MASPGYNKEVFAGGTTVVMTDEPMTRRSGTQVCFTTDPVKNAWDPRTVLVIEDNGVVVDPSNYVVDHLMGRVTFDDAYTITGPVTVTGAYVPQLSIASARAGTFNASRVSIDKSKLKQAFNDREAGRGDCTGTIESLEDGGTDHDPGAGTRTFEDLVIQGEITLFQYKSRPDSARVARAWALFESADITSELDEPTTASIGWSGALPGEARRSFSIGDPTA